MTRDYDLGMIINPEVGDEQARAIVDRVTQTVTTNGGQVVRVNAVGRRRLAYSIEHHRDGLYFFFDLMLQPDSVAELERTLRVNEDVMRHLMLLRDPRVVAQQRQRDAEADAAAATAQAAAAAQAAAQAAAAAAAPPAEAAQPVAAPATPEAPAAEVPATETAAEAPAAEAPEVEEAATEAEANA
jgi:small subunit ribosomal protein S6